MQSAMKLAAAAISVFLAACGGGGGGGAGAGLAPAPTVDVKLSDAKVPLGNSTTLTWSSTNATSCTADGAWSGGQATLGTLTVSPTAAGQYTYTLRCSGSGGTTSQSATLSVPIPVQASSYLNSKNLNIPAQKVPAVAGLSIAI